MNQDIFSEAKIGPITLRNRTIRAAAFEGMCQGNAPTQMLSDYHYSVAQGGIGMTTLAYAAVHRSGLSFPHQMWLREEIIPQLKEITERIHSTGSKVSIQIGHCGNMCNATMAGQIPISASTGFNLYSPTIVRGMKKHEIEEMAEHFGNAVNLARKAGFDCVEVHAGHGYLISQFLSPSTNHRKDEFGGSLENRMRFMKMAISKVMEAAGNDMGVVVKVNMNDGFKAGMQREECIKVCQTLESLGVHALVLSGGFVSNAPMYVMRGKMPIKTLTYYMDKWWLKLGIKMVGKYMIPAVEYKDAYFLEEALHFRKALKMPLIYVGGLTSRPAIQKVLDSGFEFVAMARVLINEPDFVNSMQKDVNYKGGCDHSNYCIARMYSREMACHKHLSDIPQNLLDELKK